MELKKPETFEDLLDLQSEQDYRVDNFFSFRAKTEDDIIYAMKDEKQEWLKELPYDLNFKFWKKKEYDRNKELEEIVDILFFILQLANFKVYYKKRFKACFDNWDEGTYKNEFSDFSLRRVLVTDFELDMTMDQYRSDLMKDYNNLCRWRKFSKKEILEKYWEKWNYNMCKRGDWTPTEVKK